MADSHVVTDLVDKRAELSGELGMLDERWTALKIADVVAVLRLFRYADPAGESNWIFRRGELQRMVLDIEREAATQGRNCHRVQAPHGMVSLS